LPVRGRPAVCSRLPAIGNGACQVAPAAGQRQTACSVALWSNVALVMPVSPWRCGSGWRGWPRSAQVRMCRQFRIADAMPCSAPGTGIGRRSPDRLCAVMPGRWGASGID
jgi:hypothetical protein